MDKLLVFVLAIGLVVVASVWHFRWMISYDRKERDRLRALGINRGWKPIDQMPVESVKAIDLDVVGGLQSHGAFKPILLFGTKVSDGVTDMGFCVYDPPAFSGIEHCRTTVFFLAAPPTIACFARRQGHRTTADPRHKLQGHISIEGDVWEISGSSTQSMSLAEQLVRTVINDRVGKSEINELGIQAGSAIVILGRLSRNPIDWKTMFENVESIGRELSLRLRDAASHGDSGCGQS